MKKTKTIPVDIPAKFTIGHADGTTPHELFNFLRWTCGHDFDYKTTEQGYGTYKTAFKYKGPFQNKDWHILQQLLILIIWTT